MKISVIVPIYNSANFLNKCLDSLINQTFNSYEIILIDDGSNDNSSNIMREYKNKYPKLIRDFYKENGGQSSARNLGIKNAKGKYIAFMDSDDYVSESFLEKMYASAIKNNSDICMCNFYIVYHDRMIKNHDYSIKNKHNVDGKEYLLSDPCPTTKIYRKEFFDKINFSFPVGRIYEDYSHIFALAKYKPSISYVDEYLIYYVQSNESTMRTNEYKKKYEDIFEATEYLVHELQETEFYEELENIVIYHFLYLASLNFYKYRKYSMIDKISNYMHNNFRNYKMNKYYKTYSLKEKVLCFLFYNKKYQIIKFIQIIKRRNNSEKNQ